MSAAAPRPDPGPAPVHGDRRVLWLASYPKSGNTWFRTIWNGFASDAAAGLPAHYRQLSSRRLFEEVAGLSPGDLTGAELHAATPKVWSHLAAGPGAISAVKAHDAFRSPLTGAPVFDAGVSVGAVYLVRNPLDVAVSLAFFSAREDAKPNFDRAVDRLNDPEAWLGRRGRISLSPQFLSDWSSHVRGWLDQGLIKVAPVRFEDMLAGAAGAFSRALADLDVPGAGETDRIKAAASAARFDRLRAREDEAGFPEKPEGAARFFREGKAGVWRRHLTAAQARRIIDAHGETMSRLGYDTEV